jgi:branched-chain amino acid transport system substrate-binding protein
LHGCGCEARATGGYLTRIECSEENTMKKILISVLGLMAWLAGSTALAEKKYDPGVNDTEIKIGQTMPYSGPVSAYGTIGKVEAAFFAKVNEEGGVNGRKIRFLSLDDGYSPPKTVEQTRRLVENEDVLLLFSSLGTAHNLAVQKYLNAKRVPQLFMASASMKWDDPQHYPWSMAITSTPRADAPLYAQYVLKNYPTAKIAVLYQNDDYGRDYVRVFKDALGPAADKSIVMQVSYEATDPTVDSQIISLHGSGADTLFAVANPKASAQTIRKVYDVGWKPLFFIPFTVASIETVLKPAGLEKSMGLISALSLKDPTDEQWADDKDMQEYLRFMKRYYPEGDASDTFNVAGYNYAHLLVYVLKQSGEDLTRENVMRQAASLRDIKLPMLLPGIKLNTSSTDYSPVKLMYLHRFNGKKWVRIGEVMGK